MKALLALACTLVLLLPTAARAQLRAFEYANGFSEPLEFVQDPVHPSVQYVVEKGGRIRVVINGLVQGTDFLDLTDSVSTESERGLLGLAFAPDYPSSGRFFVNFTNADGHTVVARFLRSADDDLRADPDSRFDLRWGGPDGQRFIVQPFANHNGGHLAFGPDGYLYIGMGDGGSSGDPDNSAQNPNALLGKMLRLDVDVADDDPEGYVVPGDNPFAGGGALPEIWAFGYRNPWKFSFDVDGPAGTGTDAMIVGDVGQNGYEEIDYEPAGAGGRNYGWRNFEGLHVYDPSEPPAYEPLTNPIFEYDRPTGHSITGGYVYRGSTLGSFYVGRYFFADFIFRRVWSIALLLDESGEATASDLIEHTTDLDMPPGNITSFGVDADGELYLVFYGGTVLEIGTDAGTPPPGGEPLSFTLTITPSGGGSVYAPGVACGSAGGSCSTTLPQGLTIGLEAEPDAGFQFQSWGGHADCLDSQITMTGDRTCAATFSGEGGGPPPPPPPPPPSGTSRLTVTRPAGGTVFGPGITCGTQGTACVLDFPSGIVLGLDAVADAGHQFGGWSAECPNGVVTLMADRTCAPSFTPSGGGDPPPPPPPPSGTARLTVTPPSGGTIYGPGIVCGSLGGSCLNDFPVGIVVGLDAEPDAGFVLTSWSAACPGGVVTLTADRTCAPTFASSGGPPPPPPPPPPPGGGLKRLTVTRPTSGTIFGAGIACGTQGAACVIDYPSGLVMAMDAVADAGATFTGWSAECANGVVVMTADRTCAPTFSAGGGPPPPPPPTGLRRLTIVATAGGTVFAPAIQCGDGGSACSVEFPAGIQLGLDVEPSSGFVFSGWTGAGCGSVITLDVDRTCTATFTSVFPAPKRPDD